MFNICVACCRVNCSWKPLKCSARGCISRWGSIMVYRLSNLSTLWDLYQIGKSKYSLIIRLARTQVLSPAYMYHKVCHLSLQYFDEGRSIRLSDVVTGSTQTMPSSFALNFAWGEHYYNITIILDIWAIICLYAATILVKRSLVDSLLILTPTRHGTPTPMEGRC